MQTVQQPTSRAWCDGEKKKERNNHSHVQPNCFAFSIDSCAKTSRLHSALNFCIMYIATARTEPDLPPGALRDRNEKQQQAASPLSIHYVPDSFNVPRGQGRLPLARFCRFQLKSTHEASQQKWSPPGRVRDYGRPVTSMQLLYCTFCPDWAHPPAGLWETKKVSTDTAIRAQDGTNAARWEVPTHRQTRTLVCTTTFLGVTKKDKMKHRPATSSCSTKWVV